MTKFEEQYNAFKELLKQNLTADNTEIITQMSEKLDELKGTHDSLQAENTKLKDKIVEVVKGTTFKETPNDPIDDSPKSFEDASREALEKIIENRKEN